MRIHFKRGPCVHFFFPFDPASCAHKDVIAEGKLR